MTKEQLDKQISSYRTEHRAKKQVKVKGNISKRSTVGKVSVEILHKVFESGRHLQYIWFLKLLYRKETA